MRDSVIMVIGGTGSFGQAFVTEALKFNPKAIRIYSRGEFAQVEMMRAFKDDRLRFLLGDVRDRDRLDAAMQGVEYIVHAAALKHVGSGEYNPQEVIKTNVIGSLNVVDIAARRGVSKIIGISSDKAVYPINLYGNTKAVMEKLFRNANSWSAPSSLFSCIRCGNFLGSRGSVIPLWEEQAKTGTITVTDPLMTRFWISLPEIARFVIKCFGLMRGGEIFIPRMSQQDMLTMANAICPDAHKIIVGRGEGEKIHEVLMSDEEHAEDHGDYWIIRGEQ